MIKRVIKLIVAVFFVFIEKTRSVLCKDGMEKPGTCVVLMYHDVANNNYHRFVQQMKEAVRLAIPVKANSLNTLENDKHHFAVTFDDGFASTIELVVPLLTHMKIPATFFIPTKFMGLSPEWICNRLRQEYVGPVINVACLKLLDKCEGVTIGSHGVNHIRLTELDYNKASNELVGSKKMLETLTGKEIKMHAFPFGAFDLCHVALAYEAGYEYVFTIDPVVVVGVNRKFVIGRVEVDPSDWLLEFRLKLLGAYRWLPLISKLKKASYVDALAMIIVELKKWRKAIII